MAVTEFLQNVKTYKLNNGESVTVTLESGTPYRHYQVWAHVAGIGVINVSVQPLFAGVADGGAVVVSSSGMEKIFQVTLEEIRPATRGLIKSSDNVFPPFVAKSEVKVTNGGANSVSVTIYQLAAADPGGA